MAILVGPRAAAERDAGARGRLGDRTGAQKLGGVTQNRTIASRSEEFTFSFDDYVITTFVSGAGSTTLPLYVFSTIRRGVTPATNAVAAIMLLITLTILVVGQLVVARNARRAGARGQTATVASMITEQSG